MDKRQRHKQRIVRVTRKLQSPNSDPTGENKFNPNRAVSNRTMLKTVNRNTVSGQDLRYWKSGIVSSTPTAA